MGWTSDKLKSEAGRAHTLGGWSMAEWPGLKELGAEEEELGYGHVCSPKEDPVPERGSSWQTCVEGLNKRSHD